MNQKIVRDQQATWDKAHRKLRREVRMAHKRAESLDDPSERSEFRKRQKQLRKLARREKRALDRLTEAEASQTESFAVYVLED